MNAMKNRYLLFLSLLMFASSAHAQLKGHYQPKYAFEQSPVPPAPDYSDTTNWAALPDKQDAADVLPTTDVVDRQATADVDVFYIHPTTYYKGDPWNADVHNQKLNAFTDKMPVMHQASVFNGSCKVYAPRYRQAHLMSFYLLDKGGKQALDLAYQDVKAAFEYYMAHYNHGRPVIIAGHSQGTYHAIRLLKEFFDGKPLQKQLVMAYLVGMPVKPADYEDIHPCTDSAATGCYVSWATFARGYDPVDVDTFLCGAVCVNPISWTTDSTYAPYNKAKGLTWIKFRGIYKHAVAAQVVGNKLWIDTPKLLTARLMHIKVWHVADYNLFWMDIRQNLKLRVSQYMAQNRPSVAPGGGEQSAK